MRANLKGRLTLPARLWAAGALGTCDPRRRPRAAERSAVSPHAPPSQGVHRPGCPPQASPARRSLFDSLQHRFLRHNPVCRLISPMLVPCSILSPPLRCVFPRWHRVLPMSRDIPRRARYVADAAPTSHTSLFPVNVARALTRTATGGLSAVVMVAQGGPDPVHGIQAANAYSDMDSLCTLRRTAEVSWLSSPWRSGSTWTLRCTHLDKRAINLSFQKPGLRSLLTSRCLAFRK